MSQSQRYRPFFRPPCAEAGVSIVADKTTALDGLSSLGVASRGGFRFARASESPAEWAQRRSSE
jgi:hypothetical protein